MTAQNAFQHLKSRGLPDHIAAGIVGNIQAESGFSEDVIAGRKLGDNGTAFGAFQHRGDRVKNLVDFARSNNLDPQRLETQLDFAIHEMTSGSDAGAKLALEEMLQTNDAGQAAQIFMQYFERPNADPNINKVDQRMYFAANMMQQGRGFKQALDEYQEQKQSDQNTQEAGSFAEQLKNYRAAQAGQTQVTDDAPQTQVPAAEFQAVSELPEIDGAIQKTMRDYQRIQTEGREAFNERNSKLAELLGKVGFSQSDEDVISQIQSIYPNAQFKQLEDGTNLVRFDGIEAVLNRPGVSGMDVSRFARDSAIIGVPSALTGGAGGVVLGGLGRLAGAGLGAGAGQIANDEMTNTADGVTSPSLERAAIATGAGVLGQGAASLVARFGPSVVNKVASLMGQNRYIKNGQPTQ